MKIIAIILFIATYVLIIALPKYRPHIALASAALFVISGILPLGSVFTAINWNALMMITGTMVVVDFFIGSRMPMRIADILLAKSPNVMWVTILLSIFAGIVSAFIDNVATVLMIAPVGLALCKKLDISPVPVLISISVSSNLQGASTLVGDTTSIMLAAYADMDFNSFFWMEGRPGIFFAVELGALGTVIVMLILFRKLKQKVEAGDILEINDKIPALMLVFLVTALIGASFIKNKPAVTNGLICIAIALISIAYDYIRYHGPKHSKRAVKSIDLDTILLLTGLFVVVAGISEAGIIEDISEFLIRFGKGNVFLLYSLFVWVSVVASAFIDNIPYVATMLPIVAAISANLGVEPYVLYFGLLSGATLGGNLTPIGASANITTIRILEKNGYKVSFNDFARIGIPFTLTAVTISYIFVWLVWHP